MCITRDRFGSPDALRWGFLGPAEARAAARVAAMLGPHHQTKGTTMTVPAGLTEELDLLRARRRSIQASLADRDDGPGDRGDEALFLELADELARVEDRIEEIERELHEPTPHARAHHEHLARGTRVRLRYADGVEEEMRVGDPAEAEDDDILTADSPLGLALVGRRPGDHLSWSTPDGIRSAEVLAVTPPG